MDQHFIQFPTFVANQVLTPESLNQVFEYLDEQERMTRVYLTGTGIVGGLPVSVSGDGTLLTIGCGCGVTTDGFLIRTDETTYNSYAPFDFTSTDVYQPFCLPAGSTTPPYRAFPIYELYNNGNINIQDNPYVPAPSGVTTYGLTNAFLQNMVVLLLCDVNSVQAQNCNTESCDGLGVTNTVTYRALLINQASVSTVLNNVGIADNKCITPDLFYGTPDLYVNRFNVYTSSICTSGQFYDAYLQSFPQELLNNMQNAFSQMYGFIKPLVVTQYPNDPFTTFVNSYTYLYDGTIVNTDNANSLIQLQYFYDYFINLIDAYNELRDCCLEISGTCCTSNMFPRHLFLGLLTSNTTPPSQLTCQTSGVYYTGFSPSGAIAGSTMANKVVALYNRLALLYKEFLLPTVTNYTAPAKPQTDPNIRITPTISGTAPLSDKSIPFYYNMQGTSPALLNAWNYQKTQMGKSNRNLSYWASNYNGDTTVVEPLKFDLEKYNFLRVEGIIGKNFANVIYNLQALKSQYRLPFDIVVTTTGACGCSTGSGTPANPPTLAEVELFRNVPDALFTDLQIDYNSATSEIVHRFVMAAERLYSVPISDNWLVFSSTPAASILSLIYANDPSYRVPGDSYGTFFEQQLYGQLGGNGQYANPIPSGLGNLLNIQGAQDGGILDFGAMLSTYSVYVMQHIYTLIQADLATFVPQISDFTTRYNDLENLCKEVLLFLDKANNNGSGNGINPGQVAANKGDTQISDIKNILIELLSLAKGGVLNDIVNEYNSRLTQFANSISFDCFSKSYPGIQHRAGVPIGGTLVLVVHYSALNGGNNGGTGSGNGNSESLANNGFTLGSFGSFNSNSIRSNNVRSNAVRSNVAAPSSASPASPTKSNNTRSNIIAGTEVLGVQNKTVENIFNFNSLFMTQLQTSYAASLGNAVALEAALDALLQDGVVCADFFLPDCIVSDVPAPRIYVGLDQQPPFVNITPGVYVVLENNNPAAAPANVTLGTLTYGPPGGTLVIGTTSVPAGSDFEPSFSPDYGPSTPNFNPYNYPFTGLKTTIPITYTLNGVVAQTSAIIYLQPVAAFTAFDKFGGDVPGSPVPRVNTYFDYTGSKNYNKIVWSFGDGHTQTIPGTTPAASPIEHIYVNQGASYLVQLTVYNDSVMAIYTQTITPNRLPIRS